jgi:hypothetical protein
LNTRGGLKLKKTDYKMGFTALILRPIFVLCTILFQKGGRS